MWEMVRLHKFNITTPILALLIYGFFYQISVFLGWMAIAWMVYKMEIAPMRLSHKVQQMWLALPTVSQYRDKLPEELKGIYGMVCIACRSRSISNRGWVRKNDLRRYFVCNHCNRTLYRP